MSERICLLLLRLYPARFRRSYGDEALLLFRDRLRDETGFFARARLWFDLLADLLSLHVHGYREIPAHATSRSRGGLSGIPLFESLDERAPKIRFLLWGGIASLILCGSALFALQYGRGHIPPAGSMLQPSSLFSVAEAKSRPRITLTYEPKDPVEGSTVRVHAVVTPRETGPIPTGTVDFFHGWNVVGRGALVNGSVTLDVKLTDHKRLPMNAIYVGDVNYTSARSFDPAH